MSNINNEEKQGEKKHVNYPYKPEGHDYNYVPEGHPYMQLAKKYAYERWQAVRNTPLQLLQVTSGVVVKDGEVQGQGTNISEAHVKNGCLRAGSPTGKDYDKCVGCQPVSHAEPTAIHDAQEKGKDTEGADYYLWGHWWCCQPCWDAMIAAGIKNVYLMEGSEVLFNREAEGNVTKHQFDDLVAKEEQKP